MKTPNYFTQPSARDYIVKPVPIHTEDTFNDICNRYIPQAIPQSTKVSKQFEHLPMLMMLKKLYEFCRTYIKYREDKQGWEQIRMPNKLWADGFGDCEDFVIFCSSILCNLGIDHTIRMADYGKGWQHIYIKVGKFTLDPVDNTFNHEYRGKYFDYSIDISKLRNNSIFKKKGLGRIGIDPNEARLNGKFLQDGFVYNRQQKIVDSLIKGEDCNISFALNITAKGYYALIPAELIQPSHIGSAENPLYFIPEAQPRNRAMSVSGAKTPELIAQNLRPEEIAFGTTAYSGSPVINQYGEVIQGNGRAYTMKYYWQNYENDPQGYTNFINKKRHTFGLPKQQIAHPVLVRVLSVTDDEAIRLGQYKQSDLEAIATTTNIIKSKVALIDSVLLDSILSNIFKNESVDKTLSELIRESSLSTLLIKKGIFRSDDFLENYTNPRTGEINADGIKMLTDLLVGLIFRDADSNTPELFKQLPDRIQTAIAKSAKYILGSKVNVGITKEVAHSIRGIVVFLSQKESGYGFKAWKTQTSMFGNSSPEQEYSPFELALIEQLSNAKTQAEIVQKFKGYYTYTNPKTDMYSSEVKSLSKDVAIAKAFGIEIPQEKVNKNNFLQQVQQNLETDVKDSKLSLEKLALVGSGIKDKNLVKELTELAIVNTARKLAHEPISIAERYRKIVDLYERQSNLSHRTSESVMFQQYSTPCPIGYLMGVYCRIDRGIPYFEPSAGNGQLTIAGIPQNGTVNELTKVRLENLKTQGFMKVTNFDASMPFNSQLGQSYEAVLTNPPFGRLPQMVTVDGYKINDLDHYMSILALKAMADKGRAAIIIGGNTSFDSEGRIQAGKNRIFINYLYAHYNVDDIINLDGHKLYSRQGTAFNVRLILIDGRKAKVQGHAPLYDQFSDSQIKSFADLYQRVKVVSARTDMEENTPKQRSKQELLALKYKYTVRKQMQELQLISS